MFQPAARPAIAHGKRFFTVTTLENGFVVATRKNNLPVAKVTVAYGAGSRHESPESKGVAHMLRAVAFQNTQERSAVRIARESELQGTQLSATGTREIIGYTARCLAAEVPSAMSFLADAMRTAKNAPYELDAERPRLKLEGAAASAAPYNVLFDGIHTASFHRGLGNSVFAPEYRVGAISKPELDKFVEDRFLSSPRCLVAHGVDHEQAVEFAEATFGTLAKPSPSTAAPVAYTGGNSTHTPTGGNRTYGVIGFNAVGASDAAVPALKVLEAIVDGTPAVKYGHSLSPVFAPGNVTGEAFTALYSDAGIMGVIVESDAADFGQKIKSVSAELKKLAEGAITAEDVKKAQAAAKLQLLQVDESAQAVEETAEQIIMNKGSFVPVSEQVAAIDAVSLADVKAIAKRVLGSSKNLVTHGNPMTVPSLAEI